MSDIDPHYDEQWQKNRAQIFDNYFPKLRIMAIEQGESMIDAVTLKQRCHEFLEK